MSINIKIKGELQYLLELQPTKIISLEVRKKYVYLVLNYGHFTCCHKITKNDWLELNFNLAIDSGLNVSIAANNKRKKK